MMTQLKGLNLSFNQLSRYIPDELHSVSTLVQIDFSSQYSWDETSLCMFSDGTIQYVNYRSTVPELGLQGAILENIGDFKTLT